MLPVEELESRLSEHLNSSPCRGIQLSVLTNGQSQNIAAGAANEQDLVPMTPRTLFPIGSIGKLFTALIVGQLEDMGLVLLDSPMTDYLPWYETPKYYERVTVADLLGHTSGLPNLPLIHPEPDEPPGCYLRRIGPIPRLFDPGCLFSLSTLAYVFLGAIVEEVMHTTWEDVVEEGILRPLKMRQTVIRPAALYGRVCASSQATEGMQFSRTLAAAGSTILTCGSDLMLLAKHMVDLLSDAKKVMTPVIAPGTLQTLLLPRSRVTSGDKFNLAAGLAFWHFDPFGKIVGHDGKVADIGTTFRLRPETGEAIAYFTNGFDNRSFVQKFVPSLAFTSPVLNSDSTPYENQELDFIGGTYDEYSRKIRVRVRSPESLRIETLSHSEDIISVKYADPLGWLEERFLLIPHGRRGDVGPIDWITSFDYGGVTYLGMLARLARMEERNSG